MTIFTLTVKFISIFINFPHLKDCHMLSFCQIKIHHFKMQFGGYFIKFYSHHSLFLSIQYYIISCCFVSCLHFMFQPYQMCTFGLWELCSEFPSLFYSKFLAKSLHYAQFYSFYTVASITIPYYNWNYQSK